MPDEEFDHEEFVKEEFGSESKFRPRGITWFWWVVALAVLAALLGWWLRLRLV